MDEPELGYKNGDFLGVTQQILGRFPWDSGRALGAAEAGRRRPVSGNLLFFSFCSFFAFFLLILGRELGFSPPEQSKAPEMPSPIKQEPQVGSFYSKIIKKEDFSPS